MDTNNPPSKPVHRRAWFWVVIAVSCVVLILPALFIATQIGLAIGSLGHHPLKTAEGTAWIRKIQQLDTVKSVDVTYGSANAGLSTSATVSVEGQPTNGPDAVAMITGMASPDLLNKDTTLTYRQSHQSGRLTIRQNNSIRVEGDAITSLFAELERGAARVYLGRINSKDETFVTWSLGGKDCTAVTDSLNAATLLPLPVYTGTCQNITRVWKPSDSFNLFIHSTEKSAPLTFLATEAIQHLSSKAGSIYITHADGFVTYDVRMNDTLAVDDMARLLAELTHSNGDAKVEMAQPGTTTLKFIYENGEWRTDYGSNSAGSQELEEQVMSAAKLQADS